MDAILNNTLLTLIQRSEVRKNIEAEAQRKAEVKAKTANAMDRASNEWR